MKKLQMKIFIKGIIIINLLIINVNYLVEMNNYDNNNIKIKFYDYTKENHRNFLQNFIFADVEQNEDFIKKSNKISEILKNRAETLKTVFINKEKRYSDKDLFGIGRNDFLSNNILYNHIINEFNNYEILFIINNDDKEIGILKFSLIFDEINLLKFIDNYEKEKLIEPIIKKFIDDISYNLNRNYLKVSDSDLIDKNILKPLGFINNTKIFQKKNHNKIPKKRILINSFLD